MDILNTLFATAHYPPRWSCGSWTPFWGWLHIISDIVIFLAYMGIPVVLLLFKHKIQRFKVKFIIILFACFIAFCGITHLNEAIIFWLPFYNFAGVVKFLTAAVSATTLVTLTLALPSIIKIINEKRQSHELKGIIESCPQGILVVSNSGKILYANQLILTMFGYELTGLVGKKVEMLIPETLKTSHAFMREQYLKAPNQRQMGIGRDLYATNKQGKKFPVEVGLNPVTFDGEAGVLCSIVDITERKTKELELNLLNKSLKQSNSELEEFAYVASHDLKEPLRGIQNYSMMLIESCFESLDEQSQHRLSKLPKLTKRLEEQIDSLLEYSRLGQLNFEFDIVDMHKKVQDTMELLENVITTFNAKIRIVGTLPPIYGNRVNLIVMLANLISNAIKYNDSDRPVIEIGALENQKNKDYHTFYLKDNGIGIPQEQFENIFKIFQRLHAKDQYGGGTGAGLTIVRKIIQKHNSRIWVESSVGKGTIFYWTLKKAPVDAHDSASTA